MYIVEFGPAAYRAFKKLPTEVQEEIKTRANALKDNPLLGEQLQGKYRLFRSLHFGLKGTQYRIIYQVFKEAHIIMIRLAGTRENIYRKLEEMRL